MVRPKTGFNQKAYYKEWYSKNKKKMKLYMRAYRHKNPDYVQREREKTRKPDGYIARRKKSKTKRKWKGKE